MLKATCNCQIFETCDVCREDTLRDVLAAAERGETSRVPGSKSSPLLLVPYDRSSVVDHLLLETSRVRHDVIPVMLIAHVPAPTPLPEFLRRIQLAMSRYK
jgi:hypothetical protein